MHESFIRHHHTMCLSTSTTMAINQSINQSICLANCATTKNECQQNNVKHSDELPEKQIAHLSWSPK